MKILITSFWNPKNTKYSSEYFFGLKDLLSEQHELFLITVYNTEEIYKEKIEGLRKATLYCFENGFSHILILNEGMVIKKEDFNKICLSKQTVSLSSKDTLNCSLIKSALLRNYPFIYAGEYSSPDRMWLKLLKQKGVKTSFISGIKPVYLDSVVCSTTEEKER